MRRKNCCVGFVVMVAGLAACSQEQRRTPLAADVRVEPAHVSSAKPAGSRNSRSRLRTGVAITVAPNLTSQRRSMVLLIGEKPLTIIQPGR